MISVSTVTCLPASADETHCSHICVVGEGREKSGPSLCIRGETGTYVTRLTLTFDG